MTVRWSEEDLASYNRRLKINTGEEPKDDPLLKKAAEFIPRIRYPMLKPGYIRLDRTKMNLTEQRFYDECLLEGHNDCTHYEPIVFEFAPRSKYTPDFVVFPDGKLWPFHTPLAIEVKGPHIHNRGSREKFKACQQIFSNFTFQCFQWKDGGWREIWK